MRALPLEDRRIKSYRLKERRKFMRQKQQIVNTLFEQGTTNFSYRPAENLLNFFGVFLQFQIGVDIILA